MIFVYFYVEEVEIYSFYRIPKLLFTKDIFKKLSAEAKILYGLIMDRISLSREHGWVMAQQKACEVATKMINGELLTNDEEQFLLTKLEK